MNYLLDTSACIRIMSGRFPAESLRLVSTSLTSHIYMSTIVLFELQYGVEKSTHRAMNELRLRRFLADTIEVLNFEPEDAAVAAVIRADLVQRKQEIGNFDVLIAGHAHNRGLTLVTTNVREFPRVDGLLWEDWSS